MYTALIIPIKNFSNSKSRLGSMLTLQERIDLTQLLVLDLIEKTNKIPNAKTIIVSSEKIKTIDDFKNVFVVYENKNLGVNNAIKLADEFIENKGFSESIIIPIDIPLLSIHDIVKIIHFSKSFKKFVGLIPSKKFDGTNILLRRPNCVIETFYDNNSYSNHKREAIIKDIMVKIFCYEHLMLDLDTPEDVVTVINKYDSQKNHWIYTDSRSINYLKNIVTCKNKIRTGKIG